MDTAFDFQVLNQSMKSFPENFQYLSEKIHSCVLALLTR